MPTNEEIVTAFCREFDAPAPNPAKLGAYFTDDAVYHNMPLEPVRGRAAIEAVLGGLTGAMASRGWEVVHQVAAGDLVMNERIDRFRAGDKDIALPVTGVFELRDGKISAWRDYFDLTTWQKQTS